MRIPGLDEERSAALLTGVCLAFLLLSFVWPPAAWISLGFGSIHAIKSSWESVKAKEIDVNILMLLAAAGSAAIGQVTEGAVLLFLFSLSSALELFALGRTKSAIEGLVRLRPAQARLLADGTEKMVPVAELKLGDVIRVLPYEAAAVDGEILEGESSLDESSMTGESVPVAKKPGDKVLAGTQNLSGSLVVKTLAPVGDTALDKVVGLVQQAQEDRSAGQKISAWFGSRYTIIVLVLFFSIFGFRLISGMDLFRAFSSSLAVFVALSPCALVIAAPAASLSALAWGARNGILIKGAQVIEDAGRVDMLAVDKTGTLTQGKFSLQRAVLLTGDETWSGGEWPIRLTDILSSAAALETHSTHPIASAIVQAAGSSLPDSTEIEVIPGVGLQGMVCGELAQVGKAEILGDRLKPEWEAIADEMRTSGLTVVWADHGDHTAIFGLMDAPRKEAGEAIAKLKELGLREVYMLTGDTKEPAAAVGRSVGVDHVQASLMPADKERIVTELEGKSKGLMYVGDGINDAPSLARARVGVAMGGLGSDIALNAAQAVLMRDSLLGLVKLRALGLKTNRVVKAGLIFAATVVICLFFGSFIADALLPEALRKVILPAAVVGHEGSTVLVILNGLRLLRGPQTKV